MAPPLLLLLLLLPVLGMAPPPPPSLLLLLPVLGMAPLLLLLPVLGMAPPPPPLLLLLLLLPVLGMAPLLLLLLPVLGMGLLLHAAAALLFCTVAIWAMSDAASGHLSVTMRCTRGSNRAASTACWRSENVAYFCCSNFHRSLLPLACKCSTSCCSCDGILCQPHDAEPASLIWNSTCW
jgi:hypothetical protein